MRIIGVAENVLSFDYFNDFVTSPNTMKKSISKFFEESLQYFKNIRLAFQRPSSYSLQSEVTKNKTNKRLTYSNTRRICNICSKLTIKTPE